MTKKHASPTMRAIAEELISAEDITQERLQKLWIQLFSDNREQAAATISELMTGSRLKSAVFYLIAADGIEMAERKLFDIKPKSRGSETK